MPIIRSTQTGRKLVFKSGSPEGSANSTYLSRSKISGRMLYFKGVGGDIDTYIHFSYPDFNFSDYDYLSVFQGVGEDPSNRAKTRTLIKCPKSKILHLYCAYGCVEGIELYIHEIDGTLYATEEVTWNTRPALGDLIESVSPAIGSWITVNTGTKGAICIKYFNETLSESFYFFYTFFSSQYENKDYRPYFTEE